LELEKRHHYDNLSASPLLLDQIPIAAIMATELTVQSERAFQKQPHIFLNSKAQSGKSKRIGKGGRRWYKDVGLGFRTPKTAIEGSYIGMSTQMLSCCGIAMITGREWGLEDTQSQQGNAALI
jgi:hypothetical protein